MTISRTKYAIGYEDAPIALMDRVKNLSGENITQSSVTSLAYRVDEYASQLEAETCTSGTEITASTSLVKTSVVFDTLQTSAPWDIAADATGYNFRLDLAGANRPNGNKWHRVEIVITPTSGGAFPLVWIVETLAMGGS